MADPTKLLWAYTKQKIRDRIPDEASAIMLANELLSRAKKAGLIVTSHGGKAFVQFGTSPQRQGAEKHNVLDASCQHAVLGRRTEFEGKDLLYVLLDELVRGMPAWAKRKYKHNSDAAQVAASLLEGRNRSLTRVRVKVDI